MRKEPSPGNWSISSPEPAFLLVTGRNTGSGDKIDPLLGEITLSSVEEYWRVSVNPNEWASEDILSMMK
jgi:hypothetical protein